MSQENVEVVRSTWDVWLRGDLNGLLGYYDPRVVWDAFREWPDTSRRDRCASGQHPAQAVLSGGETALASEIPLGSATASRCAAWRDIGSRSGLPRGAVQSAVQSARATCRRPGGRGTLREPQARLRPLQSGAALVGSWPSHSTTPTFALIEELTNVLGRVRTLHPRLHSEVQPNLW